MRNALRNYSDSRRRLDLSGAFTGKICSYPSCAFALFQSNDRADAALSSAIEMQSQVLAGAFGVSEMFKVDDAAIGQAQKIHDNGV